MKREAIRIWHLAFAKTYALGRRRLEVTEREALIQPAAI